MSQERKGEEGTDEERKRRGRRGIKGSGRGEGIEWDRGKEEKVMRERKELQGGGKEREKKERKVM